VVKKVCAVANFIHTGSCFGLFCVGGNEQGSRFFFLQHTFNFPRTRVSDAYAIHPQQLDGIKLILQEIVSIKWHCALFSFVFPFFQFLLKCLHFWTLSFKAMYLLLGFFVGEREMNKNHAFFSLQRTFNFARTRVSISER
jgi:hypothetical protein